MRRSGDPVRPSFWLPSPRALGGRAVFKLLIEKDLQDLPRKHSRKVWRLCAASTASGSLLVEMGAVRLDRANLAPS
ncbi:hypothetical protein Poly41_71580 [Novipirellula artificiosorum]|uniref:Uncharacterized protein n=1 Tax=Novipirellula artificiosorum TaxID=2528016 RepID=A0A5C6CCZ3_9BACT|nr:hypothetical protein Poly41_71580 [Novipirellula artificiosorum]